MNDPDVRDGMAIEWDAPIEMDDGLILRADVFRPPDDGKYPAILAYGPYAKGLGFEQGYPDAWRQLLEDHPEVATRTSNRYQAWEVVDPERWVPAGYACVRVDARGWGRSPGSVDPWSPREARDLYDCIEWAAAQPWCDGKVGLSGISYYAINQWHVAALRPPHLAAMIPWEGFADFYRDMNYHGGIGGDMKDVWFGRTTTTVQHGLGSRGAKSELTGELVAGPETLSDEELAANRIDFPAEIRARPLDDGWHRDRSARLEDIVVPFLSSGNWGGSSLHLRGNIEGFVHASSEQKWLEVHTGAHWGEFYSDHGVALQTRFFDHFLKGLDNGWDREPRVRLRVRTVDGGFVERPEDDWPIPRTRWTRMFLDAATTSVVGTSGVASEVSFEALASDGITFSTPAMTAETEITGPVSARLFVSSTTTDADVFLVLRVFAPDGEEVVFQGAVDPHTPVGHGWLRASHRRLDPQRCTEWRPYHPHDTVEPLIPGEPVELEIEIWPTSIVVPAGHRLALTVRGRDYEWPGADDVPELSHFKGSKMRGVGIYTHTDPASRGDAAYAGTTTVHTGGEHPSSLLLPVIPAADG